MNDIFTRLAARATGRTGPRVRPRAVPFESHPGEVDLGTAPVGPPSGGPQREPPRAGVVVPGPEGTHPAPADPTTTGGPGPGFGADVPPQPGSTGMRPAPAGHTPGTTPIRGPGPPDTGRPPEPLDAGLDDAMRQSRARTSSADGTPVGDPRTQGPPPSDPSDPPPGSSDPSHPPPGSSDPSQAASVAARAPAPAGAPGVVSPDDGRSPRPAPAAPAPRSGTDAPGSTGPARNVGRSPDPRRAAVQQSSSQVTPPTSAPSRILSAQTLVRDHLGPALAQLGAITEREQRVLGPAPPGGAGHRAGDRPVVAGVEPLELPEGGTVQVHIDRVEVRRPNPGPQPATAPTAGRRPPDHAAYLARQQDRWRR